MSQVSNLPLLAMQQVSIQFAGHSQAVVRDVSLSLLAGEKLALVGESGSGKSVLARSILQLDTGVQLGGEIVFRGQNLLSLPTHELRKVRGRKIAMIFQEPMTALNPLQTVGQQIVEVLVLQLGYTTKAAHSKACELLLSTGIADASEKMAAFPHQLSGGQRQRVMIAMALAGEPDILIADEPTTALDVTVQAQILQLLAQLQAKLGMGLLFITHDLNLVRRFADRVAVMQSGQIVEVATTESLFSSPQHAYTQSLLAARPHRMAEPIHPSAPLALQVKQLSHAYPIKKNWFCSCLKTALEPLDFSLRVGETMAVVGESGSGKTTLALAMLRLLAAGRSEGTVLLANQAAVLSAFDQLKGAALRQARRSIQIVFQDPFAALSPRQTIFEIVGEGLQVHHAGISPSERRERVIEVLQEVGLAADILERYPHEFSGGQRQRIAIARALIMQPQVMVLDEPTSALDATVQQQILQLLAQLQQKFGITYILISHDLAVVRALAHQVLVLRHGKLVEMGDVDTIFIAAQHAYTQQLLLACA
ncbi:MULTISPECIES: dipeptide ABC transporter ATP-binding protein [Deefgea]|uniref:Dipeptide ABC transporter ATP-binding protein n=1 Tax=Deefgea chitinilytica TaxID=570276 RepID=A0ABS2C8Z8_9NEIS|nr:MULTISPECIES: dipeptide ABC transporter ATP-binding protein [Deefgea]MBM5570620.1 dipeptide ABC transporter ATP-binding protein [Deefgea chitinilytica]MBM9887849.1 ABC transporter ATP-binding protein [Deefgea sp. CFH1-16]